MSEVGEFDPFYRPRVGEIAAAREEAARRGGEDLSFDDFIDLINPLHHLPFIGPLYREITGDKINPAVQVVGGAIFGGPVGMVSAVTQSIAEEATGKSLTGHALAVLFGESDTTVADRETGGTPEVAAGTAADSVAEELADAAAALPEIAPATGAESPVQLPVFASDDDDWTHAPVSVAPLGTESERPLEGVDALRAFVKDRAAATATDNPLPALDESPPPVQKSDAATADGRSVPDEPEPPALTAQTPPVPSVAEPVRFMPVRPEHFSGRVAVRGPAGFAAESSSVPAAIDADMDAGESPFAARMMEALQKYSALQDPVEDSARQRSRLP